eukprot:scaffold2300_cov116-Skeletonema_dohrnii-CCMP3373.AAC.9
MTAKIVQLFRQSKPGFSPQEWSEKVSAKAKRLEESLYRSAPSFDAYIDINTLKQRVQHLVKTRRMQKAQAAQQQQVQLQQQQQVQQKQVQQQQQPLAQPQQQYPSQNQQQPVHAEEVRQSNSVPEAASLPETDANHHLDNTANALGSAAARRLQESTASLASNGNGSTQELPPVSSRRPRGKKRKNHAPYWFRNAPVYELEGCTDGAPLKAGYVWVEYDSGLAVQVKEDEVEKRLPPRSSRRKLSHNLLDNNRGQDGSTECPVGYRFIRSVPPSKYRAGYDCDAEVVEVDGDWRRCKYVDFRGKERIGKLKLRTIQDA